MRGCLVGEQEGVKSFAKKLLDVPKNRLDLAGNVPVIDPVLLVDRVYIFLENGISMEEIPLAIYLSLFGVIDSELMDISAWVEFDTPAWEAIMLVYSGEACFYKSFRDMLALLSIKVYKTITKYKKEVSLQVMFLLRNMHTWGTRRNRMLSKICMSTSHCTRM